MSLNIDASLVSALTQTGLGIFNDLVGQALAGITESLNGALAGLLTTLGGFGKRSVHLQDLQQLINSFDLTSILQNGTFSISNILSQFQTQINSFLTSLGQPSARSTFLAAAQQTKGEIADAFNQILNESITHLTSIATALANAGLASLLTALSGKRGLFDGFADLWNGLTTTVNGHIDNLTSSIVDLGTTLWGQVQPSLQDLQDQLTNHALNAAQSLLGTLAGISGTLQG